MTSPIFIAVAAALLSDSTPCQKAPGLDAAALVRKSAEVTGMLRSRESVLNTTAFDVTLHTYESDRMYPPALTEVSALDLWFDARTGVERTTASATLGGYRFGSTTIGDAGATYSVRDTTRTPSPESHAALYATRPLSVWAMLGDWLETPDIRVEGRCVYRDYSRVVLSRQGVRGTERLFLDPKSWYPTKLDRIEPHYLWGQTHVEFVYSTWQRIGNAHLPGATFRVVDGVTEVARTYGARRFVSRDSAPPMTLPKRDEPMALAIAGFLAPTKPDTVRVSANTYLLRNIGYTETVTLARDTVFVFDATQGDERVRQDSTWIATLFPGKHPIVVVVTDLAWPHVSGVRAWVARGATIVSHRAARGFLTEVVNRRWTLAPDLLEKRRSTASLKFRAVNDSLSLAGGDILLFPIDGAASEVALAAFVRPDRFLWGSDFIQDLRSPTQYVDDVVAAAARVGVSPLKAAAEHAPLVPWERIAPLAAQPLTP